MHPKITTSVKISARDSGKDHQLISHDSSHKTIWDNRKMGTEIKQIWNENVTIVKTGFRFQLSVAKGVIQ
jgi:hypothetical protein